MVPGELARDQTLEDRFEDARRAAELTLGRESYARPLTLRLEGPGTVDRIRPFDDMHTQVSRPVKLRELNDLLKLLATSRLRAFAHSCAKPRLALGELLYRRMRRLPVNELAGIRHVVEHDLGRSGDRERLADSHRDHSSITPYYGCRRTTRSGARLSRVATTRAFDTYGLAGGSTR